MVSVFIVVNVVCVARGGTGGENIRGREGGVGGTAVALGGLGKVYKSTRQLL